MLAARKGHGSIVQHLLSGGADTTVRNKVSMNDMEFVCTYIRVQLMFDHDDILIRPELAC